jgi:hypothetical protein
VISLKSEAIIQGIQDNIAAFLLGWIFGAGLFPMLMEQITSAL